MVLLSDLVRRIYQARDAYNALKGLQGYYGLSDAEYKFALKRIEYERDQFMALLKRETRRMMTEQQTDETLSESAAPPADAEEPKKRTRKKANVE